MSVYYFQSIKLNSSLKKAFLKHFISRGVSLGFIYKNTQGIILSKDEAIEYVLTPPANEYNSLIVFYQDTSFDLTFFNYHNFWISMSPHSTDWSREAYGYHRIDNIRYSRLLLYLCQDLPIMDFEISNDHYSLNQTERNTITFAGGFGPQEEGKSNAKIIINNIYSHEYKPIDISFDKLQAGIAYALENIEPFSFNLKIDSYTVKISIADLITVTAIEPYAKKIINNKEYNDVAFYVNVGFNITEPFFIVAVLSNFASDSQLQ